ncbi:MAG: ABC transporter permease [Alphaproteobacteria bacterium]|jgi:peptide/nickel transport system permease protein
MTDKTKEHAEMTETPTQQIGNPSAAGDSMINAEQPDRQGLTKLFYNFGLLRESPAAIIGLSIIVFWVLIAIFADLVTVYPPNVPDYEAFMKEPFMGAHWLGTDILGRDIWSRVAFGARTTLIVAPVAMLCAYTLGIIMGMLAGYYGGWVDNVISRVSDIILSFPLIILFIVIISVFGASAFNIIVAVTLAASPGIGRIVRGLTLDLRSLEYVSAAQIRGENGFYIMMVELLPNARGPLIVDACLRMGYTIITIGILGFLGLGLPPPDPDWGGMVANNIAMVNGGKPFMAIIPAVAISSLVIGFNLLADGLREISVRD